VSQETLSATEDDIQQALERLPLALQRIPEILAKTPEIVRALSSMIPVEVAPSAYEMGKHVCPGCGVSFESLNEMLLHRERNLWESHYIVDAGRHICKICWAKFDTKEKFLNHWKIERHDDLVYSDFILSQSRERRAQEQWDIVPTEEIELERRIWSDQKLKKLRYGTVAGHIFRGTIIHRKVNKAFIVGEGRGYSESGKSTFAFSAIILLVFPLSRRRLAEEWLKNDENYAASIVLQAEALEMGRHLGIYSAAIELMKDRKEWREPRIWLSWGLGDTARLIRHVHPQDVIWQDEDPGIAGQNRDTVMMQIRTLLKLFRLMQVDFFFISPTKVSYVENANLRFQTTHKMKPLKRHITRGILFENSDDVAIGWIQMQVLTEERIANQPIYMLDPKNKRTVKKTEYLAEKKTMLKRMQRQMGLESADTDWDIVDEDVRRMRRSLKKRYKLTLEELAERPKSWFEKRVSTCGVKGNTRYQDLVAEETYTNVQIEQSREYVKKVTGKELDEEPEEEEPELQFSLDPLDYLDQIEAAWMQDPKKVKIAHWVAHYRRFVKESRERPKAPTQKEIAGWAGLSSSGNVSEMFQRIDSAIHKLQGDAFEIKMFDLYSPCAQVLNMKPQTRAPEPKEKPDRVVFLTDGTVRVCSWKHYPSNATIPIQGPEMLEARALLAKGAKVQLILEGICPHGFFSVELDPDDEKKHRTIHKRECQSFPPDMNQLLGVTNK
jgi:hypothetical protein